MRTIDRKKVLITGAGKIIGSDPLDHQDCYAVNENELLGLVGNLPLRHVDKVSKLALAAALMVKKNSFHTRGNRSSNDDGLVLGTIYGALDSIHQFDMTALRTGALSVNPGHFPNTVLNAPACQTGIQLAFAGPVFTVCNGMNSGLDAVGLGYNQIISGMSSAVLAGGVDEITELQLMMHAIRRPLYEASAFVLLEGWDETALRKNHPVVNEITGYESTALFTEDQGDIPGKMMELLGRLLQRSHQSVDRIDSLFIGSELPEDEEKRITDEISKRLGSKPLILVMQEDYMAAAGVIQTIDVLGNGVQSLEQRMTSVVLNVSSSRISALCIEKYEI